MSRTYSHRRETTDRRWRRDRSRDAEVDVRDWRELLARVESEKQAVESTDESKGGWERQPAGLHVFRHGGRPGRVPLA